MRDDEATADPWVGALAAFKTYIEARASETEAHPRPPRIHDHVMNDPQANKTRSKQLYYEVFGQANYDAADAILSEDHVSHGPGFTTALGSSGIKRQARLLHTAFSDFRVELLDQLAEDDRVASRWRVTGVHNDPFNLPSGSVAATGRTITFDEIRIDRHYDSRIAESWFIPDRLVLWEQLGLTPSPPSP